jgi:hypothetical protein
MRTHKDLSFVVTTGDHRQEFRRPNEALVHAFVLAASGRNVTFDVLAFSRGAAKAWSGDAGAESYDEDPEASVFERYELSVHFTGRVA